MQVKKFEAPTIQEALEKIKKEFGPEAILLQTKQNRKGFLSKSSVEVTVAVSERSLHKKKKIETHMPPAHQLAMQNLSAKTQADIFDQYGDEDLKKPSPIQEKVELSKKHKDLVMSQKMTQTRYVDILDEHETPLPELASVRSYSGSESIQKNSSILLEAEVRALKGTVEKLQKNQSSTLLDGPALLLEAPALYPAFEHLILNGVDRKYALALIKKVGFEFSKDQDFALEEKSGTPITERRVFDALANEIMESIEIQSLFKSIHEQPSLNGPSVFALIGPTGVGKTTTIAKMAHEAQTKYHLKVGLLNFDYYKNVAFEELGTYAKILNIPFRSAKSIEDIKASLIDFKNFDVVIIDTAGKSQKDPNGLKEIQSLLKLIPDSYSFLILSATTRDSDLYDIVNRFSILNPKGIVFSKLDETTIYGSIYNVYQKFHYPMIYFTTGQEFPGDIEEASCERVASLLIEI